MTEEDTRSIFDSEDPRLWQRDMRRFQRAMFRYMTLFWFFAPYILFAPLWNAVHARPAEQGEWFGFILVAVLVLPFWIAMGVVGRRLRNALLDLEDQQDEIYAAREAERKLLIRRAERQERAEARLARIEQKRMMQEREGIVEDLERIRRELDTD